jgi:superoxide dismutase, Cu-Zn family
MMRKGVIAEPPAPLSSGWFAVCMSELDGVIRRFEMKQTLLIAGFAALTACAPVVAPPPPMAPAQPAPTNWRATLQAQSGFANYAGEAVAQSNAAGTAVSIGFSRPVPAGESPSHPWHIHSGTCGSGGPVVGDMNAYPPLRIADQRATASASVNVPLRRGEPYHVNVHRSAQEMSVIVACGELRMQ